MPPSPHITSFPDTFRIMTGQTTLRYARQPDLYAVHGSLPSHLKTSVEYTIEEDVLTICRGTPPLPADLPASLTLTAVYRVEPHGALAVPTGRIYVRCKPGTSVNECRTQFEKLGYRIVEVPPYAPHTAWVQATTGNAATSLRNFEHLNTLPDVEHVEPQLLMQRTSR